MNRAAYATTPAWSAALAAGAGLMAYPIFCVLFAFMSYINASPARLFVTRRLESHELLELFIRVPIPFALAAALGVFGLLRTRADRWGAIGRRARMLAISSAAAAGIMAIVFAAAQLETIQNADAKVTAALLALLVLTVVATIPIDRSAAATLSFLVAMVPVWLASVVAIRILYVVVTGAYYFALRAFHG